MVALRLVRLIEAESDKIARNLVTKIRKSSRASQLQRVPEGELLASMQQLLEHLREWLLTKTKTDIEVHYRAAGARLWRQNVPLADACWTVVIIKEHLWDFLQKQAFLRSPVELYGEIELLCLLNHFFDRALCHMAEGYERERKKTGVEPEVQKKYHELNLAAFVP
jgi:hypothetical protein